MASGLNLDIGANTREAQASIKDVSGALDQVADSLDDAARDGDRSTERLEASFRELAQAAERDGNRAGQNLAQGLDKGAQTASDTMQEVKSEAIANASEVFSSFDGSASSFVDGIQGTFGGLIAGLAAVNPALIPVATAAALTIGSIAAAVTGAEENTEAFRAKVAELTAEFIETGAVGGRTFSGMTDEVRALIAETDQSKASLERLSGLSKDLGANFEDVVTAYAQGGRGLDDLIDKTESLAASERVRALELQGVNDYQAAQASNRAADLEHELGLLRTQRDAIADATVQQQLYYSSGISELEAKAGLIEAINTAYDEAAGSTADFIEVETGVFDTTAYIAAMQARETALRDYQTTLASSGLSDQARAFLNEQGADAAAAMLAGYQGASAQQKAELDRIWTEAARANSGTYTETLSKDLGKSKVAGPTVDYSPSDDAAAYRTAFQRALNQNGPLVLNIRAVDRYGRDI